MDIPTNNPVWQTANDVVCKSAEEFAFWINLFRKAGKPEQAVILEAQLLRIHPSPVEQFFCAHCKRGPLFSFEKYTYADDTVCRECRRIANDGDANNT